MAASFGDGEGMMIDWIILVSKASSIVFGGNSVYTMDESFT